MKTFKHFAAAVFCAVALFFAVPDAVLSQSVVQSRNRITGNLTVSGTTAVTGAVTGASFATTNVTVGASSVSSPQFQETTAVMTAGSGTGITLANGGAIKTQVYKITVAATAITCASTTCPVTIGTLTSKMFVTHIIADLTQVFACTATCTSSTLQIRLGKATTQNQYLVLFDADAATGQFGDAAAELGASLTEATIPTALGDLGSWSGTQAMVMDFVSGTGNLGNGSATNLSQGSVTFYVTTTRYP